jgi:hypothetical protein
MSNFQQEVHKRFLELKALQTGGLRRKRQLNRYTDTTILPNTVIHSITSEAINLRADIEGSHTSEIWGFVRYTPMYNLPKTDAELMSLARRAILGLKVDFSSAWELMPWSWLIDWCSSVGDFFAARKNLVPCTHSTPQIMEHRKSSYTIKVVSGTMRQGFTPQVPGPWTVEFEGKQRRLSNPSISVHLPVLTERQFSILGAIAVQRYR